MEREMKEKQIEEMTKALCHMNTCASKKDGSGCYKYCKAYIYAFRAVNAGYRKQSEGEWIHTDKANHWFGKDECNQCHYHDCERIDLSHFNYCPNCGAKMKGGAE